MTRSEPANEEDLPTFSLGLEFLTPEKKPKEKEKKNKQCPCHRFSKNCYFQTPISLSQRENTPFRNDKLKKNC